MLRAVFAALLLLSPLTASAQTPPTVTIGTDPAAASSYHMVPWASRGFIQTFRAERSLLLSWSFWMIPGQTDSDGVGNMLRVSIHKGAPAEADELGPVIFSRVIGNGVSTGRHDITFGDGLALEVGAGYSMWFTAVECFLTCIGPISPEGSNNPFIAITATDAYQGNAYADRYSESTRLAGDVRFEMVQANSVPEPSTALLLGAGAMLLAVRRWQTKRISV